MHKGEITFFRFLTQSRDQNSRVKESAEYDAGNEQIMKVKEELEDVASDPLHCS